MDKQSKEREIILVTMFSCQLFCNVSMQHTQSEQNKISYGLGISYSRTQKNSAEIYFISKHASTLTLRGGGGGWNNQTFNLLLI